MWYFRFDEGKGAQVAVNKRILPSHIDFSEVYKVSKFPESPTGFRDRGTAVSRETSDQRDKAQQNGQSLVIRRDTSVYSFLSRVKTSDDRRGIAKRENDLSDRTIDQFSQEGWLIDERWSWFGSLHNEPLFKRQTTGKHTRGTQFLPAVYRPRNQTLHVFFFSTM